MSFGSLLTRHSWRREELARHQSTVAEEQVTARTAAMAYSADLQRELASDRAALTARIAQLETDLRAERVAIIAADTRATQAEAALEALQSTVHEGTSMRLSRTRPRTPDETVDALTVTVERLTTQLTLAREASLAAAAAADKTRAELDATAETLASERALAAQRCEEHAHCREELETLRVLVAALRNEAEDMTGKLDALHRDHETDRPPNLRVAPLGQVKVKITVKFMYAASR